MNKNEVFIIPALIHTRIVTTQAGSHPNPSPKLGEGLSGWLGTPSPKLGRRGWGMRAARNLSSYPELSNAQFLQQMTAAEYLAWEPQQVLRYEYINHEVVAMTGKLFLITI